jgi:hypothetical protein
MAYAPFLLAQNSRLTFFCFCKRKWQRKAEPILMQNSFSAEFFLGQNRRWEINLCRTLSVETLASGMSRFC